MKKYLYLCIALSIISACNDFLKLDDPNMLTNETFWKNSQDAEQGLIATYKAITQTYIYNSQGIKNMNCRGDDIIARLQNPQIYGPDLFINDPSNTFAREMWKDCYGLIYKANQVIDNVPNISMDEIRRSEIVGEAMFLRALAYFILANNFNEVPLVLKSKPNSSELFPSKVSSELVFQQIINDLTKAKAVLKKEISKSNLGRASRYAACAYLGKAYLYTKQWAKAEIEFDEIIKSEMYELTEDVNDNFINSKENNIESIFEVQYNYFTSSSQITGRAIHFAPNEAGGYFVATPSPWIFEEFQKERTINNDLDPRMYATFFWNYPNSRLYQKPFSELFSKNLNYVTWKKYQQWDLTLAEASLGRSDINERIMRFSHVLLMHAEALNEQNKTSSAIASVNKIRKRAQLNNLKPNINQVEMRIEIAHQRALEFCFEGERWYDIVRWGIGETVFKENLIRSNYIKGKFDFFPIPQSELDANKNLTQNNNW